jgi:hypothetical protein
MAETTPLKGLTIVEGTHSGPDHFGDDFEIKERRFTSVKAVIDSLAMLLDPYLHFIPLYAHLTEGQVIDNKLHMSVPDSEVASLLFSLQQGGYVHVRDGSRFYLENRWDGIQNSKFGGFVVHKDIGAYLLGDDIDVRDFFLEEKRVFRNAVAGIVTLGIGEVSDIRYTIFIPLIISIQGKLMPDERICITFSEGTLLTLEDIKGVGHVRLKTFTRAHHFKESPTSVVTEVMRRLLFPFPSLSILVRSHNVGLGDDRDKRLKLMATLDLGNRGKSSKLSLLYLHSVLSSSA